MAEAKQSNLLIVNFLATFARIAGVVIIGFFLTPILIGQLGVEVFGLLTTLGAAGGMLVIVTNTLQISIARELGVSVGKDDKELLQKTFSTAFVIQLVAGLTFLGIATMFAQQIANGLTIPDGFKQTTFYCLILVFIQFTGGIITSPFGGMIRAYQHLRTISIIQLLTRLGIFVAAVSMIFVNGDKLLFFVAASLIVNLLSQLAQVWLSVRRYPASKPLPNKFSLEIFKSICRYGGFALIGGIGGQIRRNGIAVVLNIFFGNIVTAANGIAIRLSNLISQAVSIVHTTIQPAMNMNQGAGKKSINTRLTMLSSTIGFAIALPLVVPLVADTQVILESWLRIELPEFAVLFSQLTAITFLFSMISKGHNLAMHANGKIGWLVTVNQLLIAGLIIIGALVACTWKTNPWLLPAGEMLGMMLVVFLWQPYWVGRKLSIPTKNWIDATIKPCFLMLSIGLLFSGVVAYLLPSSLWRATILGAAVGLICFAILWRFGFNASERDRLLSFFRRQVQRIQRAETKPS